EAWERRDMANPPLAGVLRHLRQLVGAKEADEQGDGQLLQRFITQRDEAAFAALLQRHGPLVLGGCRQILRNTQAAEDAFHATFRVRARRANSIRAHQALAGWLYRVAFNLATTARASALRRHAQERQAAMSEVVSTHDTPPHDWQPLHEEVNRLPEKY